MGRILLHFFEPYQPNGWTHQPIHKWRIPSSKGEHVVTPELLAYCFSPCALHNTAQRFLRPMAEGHAVFSQLPHTGATLPPSTTEDTLFPMAPTMLWPALATPSWSFVCIHRLHISSDYCYPGKCLLCCQFG